MKTIQVTDEMYESLMELSKEILTQDNRSTAMPYLFQIRTREEIPVYPGQDGITFFVNDEGDELRDSEEIKEEVLQIWEAEGENASFKFKGYDKLNGWDIKYIIEKAGWREIVVKEQEVYQNAFFTAKACDEHIRLNKHHYRKPDCYLSHAGRNPEMDLIQKFLCELSGGEWRG